MEVDDDIIEHQPKFELNHFDNGSTQWLSLSVQLPGATESEIHVSFAWPDIICRVPGKYRLCVPIPNCSSSTMSPAKQSFRQDIGVLLIELPLHGDLKNIASKRQPKTVPCMDPSFAADALKLLHKTKSNASKAKKKRGAGAKKSKSEDIGDYANDLDRSAGEDLVDVVQPIDGDSNRNVDDNLVQPPSPDFVAFPKPSVESKNSRRTFSENLRRGMAPKQAQEFIESSHTFAKVHELAIDKQTEALAKLDGELGDVLKAMSSSRNAPNSPGPGSESGFNAVHAHCSTSTSNESQPYAIPPSISAQQQVSGGKRRRTSQENHADATHAPTQAELPEADCKAGSKSESQLQDDEMYSAGVRNARKDAAVEAYDLGMTTLKTGASSDELN